jgi:hypothetical protein
VIAIGCLIAARVAQAAPDYAPASTEWNGLAKLFDEARAAGCEIEAAQTLDWSALEGNDVLWFVYPRAPVDAQKLKRWLAAGGRAVIADDFGAAAQALEALDIRRGRVSFQGTGDDARYNHNPHLPIAHVRFQTDLSRATREIVANHPSSFETATPATWEFQPGAALVVEGHVAKGYFVAIADPSVLINNMLEIDGNRAFAHALVQHTCRAGQDRIHLYTQTFTQRGEPRSELPPAPETESLYGQFNKKMTGVNGGLKGALVDGRALTLLASALAVIALALFGTVFPARNEIRDRWTRVGRLLQPAHESDHALAGLPWDYAMPAAIVREEALERLQAALGETLDFDYLGPQALERKVTARLGPVTGARAAELWRILHRVRWRSVDGEIVPDERVARRTLLRMHQLAVALFDSLAENPKPEEKI